jgi:predicted RNA-binding Zn ribbon-like protein
VEFLFVGNARWVDFVNTELSDGQSDFELLPDFEQLLRWGRESGALDEPAARAIAETAAAGRAKVVREAHQLRTELRASAQRMAQGEVASGASVALVNSILRDHPRALQLQRHAAGWSARHEELKIGARVILARVAEDFAEFLSSADPSTVRRCENSPCKIFFHDTSRNRARRWCSMRICGNRSKVARHRSRQAH